MPQTILWHRQSHRSFNLYWFCLQAMYNPDFLADFINKIVVNAWSFLPYQGIFDDNSLQWNITSNVLFPLEGEKSQIK